MTIFKSSFSSHCVFAGILLFSVVSCNKKVEQFPETPVVPPSGISIGATLGGNTDMALFNALVTRAGMSDTLNNINHTFTIYAAGNNAMKQFVNAASGGLVPLNAPDAVFAGFIGTVIPAATATAIVSYNIIPLALPSASVPPAFPNFQYPSIFNPAPSISALLRLTTFPSNRNGAWINNIPIAGADVVAANGIIHPTGALVTPPQRFLWDRINTDTTLTYLKAALIRADSGVAVTSASSLVGGLQNIGANLTVFAPTDSAFRSVLTFSIYQGLVGLGVPAQAALPQATFLASTPAVFSNPLLFPILTAQTVKGIAVYHILPTRAFTNNFPTTGTYYPTLLNGAIAAHPGVNITAVFGVPFVSSATVKGLGNATPSKVIINPSPLLPDPVGSSDQHYLNGVLHKIDQLLLPQ